MTPDTIIILEENIKRTIRTYEPRCNLRNVEVIGNLDTAELSVRIVFSVINTTNTTALTIDLSRVR